MTDEQIAGAACSGGSRAGRVFRGAVEVADASAEIGGTQKTRFLRVGPKNDRGGSCVVFRAARKRNTGVASECQFVPFRAWFNSELDDRRDIRRRQGRRPLAVASGWYGTTAALVDRWAGAGAARSGARQGRQRYMNTPSPQPSPRRGEGDEWLPERYWAENDGSGIPRRERFDGFCTPDSSEQTE